MGELINGRTPEDLKDALMRCGRRHCKAEGGDCPYYIDCLVGATRLKLMKDAFDYIRYLESERDAAMAKQPKWISVKERLPDAFVSVIVQMPGEKPHPTVREGFISNDGIWCAGHFRRKPDEVTHWAKMPEPPGEEPNA